MSAFHGIPQCDTPPTPGRYALTVTIEQVAITGDDIQALDRLGQEMSGREVIVRVPGGERVLGARDWREVRVMTPCPCGGFASCSTIAPMVPTARTRYIVACSQCENAVSHADESEAGAMWEELVVNGEVRVRSARR